MKIKNFLEKLQEDSSIELFDRFKTKTLTNKGWITGANLSIEIAKLIGDTSTNKNSSLIISKKIQDRAKSSNAIEDLSKQDLQIDTSNLENGKIFVYIYDEQGNKVDTVTIVRTNDIWSVVG